MTRLVTNARVRCTYYLGTDVLCAVAGSVLCLQLQSKSADCQRNGVISDHETISPSHGARTSYGPKRPALAAARPGRGACRLVPLKLSSHGQSRL